MHDTFGAESGIKRVPLELDLRWSVRRDAWRHADVFTADLAAVDRQLQEAVLRIVAVLESHPRRDLLAGVRARSEQVKVVVSGVADHDVRDQLREVRPREALIVVD